MVTSMVSLFFNHQHNLATVSFTEKLCRKKIENRQIMIKKDQHLQRINKILNSLKPQCM